MNSFEVILFSIAAIVGFLYVFNSLFANKLFSKNFSEIRFKKMNTREMHSATSKLLGVFLVLFMLYVFGSMEISERFEDYSAAYIGLNLLLMALYLFIFPKTIALFHKTTDMEEIMIEKQTATETTSETVYPWHALITGGIIWAVVAILYGAVFFLFREAPFVQWLIKLEQSTVSTGTKFEGWGIVSIAYLMMTLPIVGFVMRYYAKKFPHRPATNRGLSRNVSWWVVIVVLIILILLPAIIGAIYSDLAG